MLPFLLLILMKVQVMTVTAVNEDESDIAPLWMTEGDQEKSTSKVLYISPGHVFLSYTDVTRP